MLKIVKMKSYNFEMSIGATRRPVLSRNIISNTIKPETNPKVPGFFISNQSLMHGLFCTANLGEQNQTSVMSHPFKSVLSFQGKKSERSLTALETV